ncbi:hypothetical protein ACFODZ_07390 [Marinicella sediminis]|uniref:Uncharacterized protein n=1 Tax=Marinicella sediminis TaxID=1792834 RepID=A0ABV7J7F2_9GAMM|nr:hypothetical protein [Marinicella sediminis]
MAKTPEQSDYTSIQERIKDKNTRLIGFGYDENDQPFSLSGYLDLVDFSGRAILETKRGYIPENLPPILDRLGLDPDTWLDELKGIKSVGFTAVGTVDQLKSFCQKVGKRFAVGHRKTSPGVANQPSNPSSRSCLPPAYSAEIGPIQSTSSKLSIQASHSAS